MGIILEKWCLYHPNINLEPTKKEYKEDEGEGTNYGWMWMLLSMGKGTFELGGVNHPNKGGVSAKWIELLFMAGYQ